MDRINDIGSDSGVCSDFSICRNRNMKRSSPVHNVPQDYDSLSEFSVNTNQSAQEYSSFDENQSGECNDLRNNCRQDVMDLVSWLDNNPTQNVILDHEVHTSLSTLSEASLRYTRAREDGDCQNIKPSARPDADIGRSKVSISSVIEKIQKFEQGAPERLSCSSLLRKNINDIQGKDNQAKAISIGVQCNTEIPIDSENKHFINLDEVDSIRREDFYISNIDDESNVSLENLLQDIILPTVKRQIEKQLNVGDTYESRQHSENIDESGKNRDSFMNLYNEDSLTSNLIKIYQNKRHVSSQTSLDIKDVECQTIQMESIAVGANIVPRYSTVSTQCSIYSHVPMKNLNKTSKNIETDVIDAQREICQISHGSTGKDYKGVTANTDMTIKITIVPQQLPQHVDVGKENNLIEKELVKKKDTCRSNTQTEGNTSLKLKSNKFKKNAGVMNSIYSERKELYGGVSEGTLIQTQSKFSLVSETTKAELQIDHCSHHLKSNSMYRMHPRCELETIERARIHFRRVFEPLQRSLTELQSRVKAICMDPLINAISTDCMPCILETEINSPLGASEPFMNRSLQQQTALRRNTASYHRSHQPNRLTKPEIVQHRNEIMQMKEPINYPLTGRRQQHICKNSKAIIEENVNPECYMNEPRYLHHRSSTCDCENYEGRRLMYDNNKLVDKKTKSNLTPYNFHNVPNILGNTRKNQSHDCESNLSSESLKSSAVTALDMKEFYEKGNNHRTSCSNTTHQPNSILPLPQERQTKRRVHKSSEARRKDFFVGTVNYYVEHKAPYCKTLYNKELVGKKTCPWKHVQKNSLDPVLSDPDYRWSTSSIKRKPLRTKPETGVIPLERYVLSTQQEHERRRSYHKSKYVS